MSTDNKANILSWKGENWSLVGPSWPGISEIKYLIIFGASYSQTSVLPQNAPTEDEPLGVPFPGVTYTEGPPNWVGYLAKERRLLTMNYALGGATISGIQSQITREFMEYHPPSMPWSGCDTIFVTWAGSNDLWHDPDIPATIDTLFELQNELYNKGARNFLFCDVPCLDRSPAYKNAQVKEIRARFNSWNMTLDKAIRSFVADKSTTDDPITAIYFSSHRVFTALLNHPKKYGFPQKDIAKSRRSIWIDHLHPTSAVHHILASELDSLLSSISPFAPCRH